MQTAMVNDRVWCVVSRAAWMAALLVTLAAGPAAAQSANPSLASVDLSGQAAGLVMNSCISADGRSVAFECWGSNLVPGGAAAMHRVYVRDLLLGQTEAACLTSNEVLADGNSHGAAMTADARYVTFSSGAPNLLDGNWHLFVRDRLLGTTTLLDLEGENWQLSDDASLAFIDNGQVFAKHIATGVLETVSVNDLGVPADAPCRLDTNQCVSADARFVVFQSAATNLGPGVTSGFAQVYVRDRSLGTTRLLSATAAGVPGDGSSIGESISADGRFVAFSSSSKNLAGLPPSGRPQSFVCDLATGALELVSVSNLGAPSTGISVPPAAWPTSISGDGRFVAFSSTTDNLLPGLGGTKLVCLIRDRLAGLTFLASPTADGQVGGGLAPMLSRDGRVVAFWSSDPLVPQDTNVASDLYVFDRLPWSEIEQGLAGSAGVPRLVMQGVPAAHAPFLLAITRTPPSTFAHLVFGLGQVNLPFKGGVLVPAPSLIRTLHTNVAGKFIFASSWPAGVPAGTALCMQAWVVDPAGPFGFSASNAVASIAQ